MPRKNILDLLSGGDRRSLGRAEQVAARVADKPRLFPELIAGLWSRDRLVRMRAADAAEKVTRRNPGLLRSRKKEILGLMAEAAEPELRWHLALMVSRLKLNASERQVAISLLTGYLEDRSSIVRTFALQGLAELALNADTGLGPCVIEILRQAVRSGTPAMKARSRILLRQLESEKGSGGSSMSVQKFTARIATEGGGLFMEVPLDVKAEFGRARPAVRASVNGYGYRTTIAVYGGKYYLGLRKADAAAADVKAGDIVKVSIEPDIDIREVEVPPELAAALKKNAAARARWEKLSYTHKKEHADAILKAKKPETRARRIQKAVKMLSVTKP